MYSPMPYENILCAPKHCKGHIHNCNYTWKKIIDESFSSHMWGAIVDAIELVWWDNMISKPTACRILGSINVFIVVTPSYTYILENSTVLI